MFDKESFWNFEGIGVGCLGADVDFDFLCVYCEGPGGSQLEICSWRVRSACLLSEELRLCWAHGPFHD